MSASLQNIRTTEDSVLIFEFESSLGLGLGDSTDISVDGSFNLEGQIRTDLHGRQYYRHDRIKLNGFSIDATIAGNSVNGELYWFENNSVFGDGFKGALEANFKGIGANVSVAGQFGKIDSGGPGEYSYYMIDAMVRLENGIPIAGPLSLTGLGGGVSYHMSRNNGLSEDFYAISPGEGSSDSLSVGQSYSGVEYVPDIDIGIHFKLNVEGTLVREKLCKINAEYGGVFNSPENSDSGISRLYFNANAVLLEDFDFNSMPDLAFAEGLKDDRISSIDGLNVPNGTEEAKIRGYIILEMDFGDNENGPVFNATAGIFVEVGNVITGKALAELKISNESWYFNVGRISTNNYELGDAELDVNLGFINFAVQTYLNMGSEVPKMPSLPNELVQMFPGYEATDHSLNGGNGVAFGLRTDVELNLNFVIVRVAARGIFGFDLALKQYDNVFCQNTNSELGINGWYSMGQAYLYFSAKIKLLFWSIGKVAVGAYVQMGFPNPGWIKGQVGISYGRKKATAKVKFGDKCIPEQGDLSVVKPDLVWGVSPPDNSRALKPNNAEVNIYCSFPLSEHLDLNGDRYLISLDSAFFEFQGRRIESFDQVDLVDNTVVKVTTANNYPLPSNDTIKFIYYFGVNKNGITDNSLMNAISDTLTFITPEIDYLKTSDIKVTYPLDGMTHFHPNEYDEEKGIILLARRYYDLAYDPETNLVTRISQKADSTNFFISQAHYNIRDDYLGDEISFGLPPDELESESDYVIELFKLSSDIEVRDEHNMAPDEAIFEAVTNIDLNDNQQLLRHLREEEPIYEINFRTSKYATFADKISALGLTEFNTSASIDENTDFIDIPIADSNSEGFDLIEIGKPIVVSEFMNQPLSDHLNHPNTSLIETNIDWDKFFYKNDDYSFLASEIMSGLPFNHLNYNKSKRPVYYTIPSSFISQDTTYIGSEDKFLYDLGVYFNESIGFGKSQNEGLNGNVIYREPSNTSLPFDQGSDDYKSMKLLFFNGYHDFLVEAYNDFKESVDHVNRLECSCNRVVYGDCTGPWWSWSGLLNSGPSQTKIENRSSAKSIPDGNSCGIPLHHIVVKFVEFMNDSDSPVSIDDLYLPPSSVDQFKIPLVVKYRILNGVLCTTKQDLLITISNNAN